MINPFRILAIATVFSTSIFLGWIFSVEAFTGGYIILVEPDRFLAMTELLVLVSGTLSSTIFLLRK